MGNVYSVSNRCSLNIIIKTAPIQVHLFLHSCSFHIRGCDWHLDYAWLTLISLATTVWDKACMGMLCLDESFIFLYVEGKAISCLSVKLVKCWKYCLQFLINGSSARKEWLDMIICKNSCLIMCENKCTRVKLMLKKIQMKVMKLLPFFHMREVKHPPKPKGVAYCKWSVIVATKTFPIVCLGGGILLVIFAYAIR